MKKGITAFISLLAIPLCAASATVMTPDGNNFNVYGNAFSEKVTDEGRPAVHVKLGGVNTQKGGAFQVFPKVDSKAANGLNGLSLLLRGDGDNGSVVVLLVDSADASWCWNGQRWESSAAISCANDMPRKLVLPLSEFRKCSGTSSSIDLSKLKSIHIGIGPNLNDPAKKAAGFYLYSILLEKDAVSSDTLPVPAAEDSQKKK